MFEEVVKVLKSLQLNFDVQFRNRSNVFMMIHLSYSPDKTLEIKIEEKKSESNVIWAIVDSEYKYITDPEEFASILDQMKEDDFKYPFDIYGHFRISKDRFWSLVNQEPDLMVVINMTTGYTKVYRGKVSEENFFAQFTVSD